MRVDGRPSRKALGVPVHHAAAGKDDGPVPWAPELGQVFLGNVDDVPLMRDPDGPMMHFHSGGPGRKGLAGEGLDLFSGGGGSPGADGDVDMRGERLPYGDGDGGGGVEDEDADEGEEEEEDEDLPEDDPFNYLPTNDPGKSMGYDICFECHDRAPYPSPAHLRAAEEHLGMLEVMWARRCMERENARPEWDWEAKSKAKAKKGGEEGEGGRRSLRVPRPTRMLLYTYRSRARPRLTTRGCPR